MTETAKITIEKAGEPTVVLTIDARDAPVSLGNLLDRARSARARQGGGAAVITEHYEIGRSGVAGESGGGSSTFRGGTGGFPEKAGDPWPKTAETASTRPTGEQVVALLRRIADAGLGHEILQPSEARVVLEMLESAARGGLTPGSIVFKAPPNLDNDLEDVLDSYRLAGKMAGVQVFAVDHVVAWVGDIERIREPMDGWRLRLPAEPGPIFFKCIGANAIEEAAKYLRTELERPVIPTGAQFNG